MVDDIHANDLAAARLYVVQSHERLVQCVNEATRVVKPYLRKHKFANFSKKTDILPGVCEAYICSWGKKGRIKIDWGFWFGDSIKPEEREWTKSFDPEWKAIEAVYVGVEFPNTIIRPSGRLFSSWTFPKADSEETIVWKLANFQQFLQQGSGTDGIVKWLFSAVEEAIGLMEQQRTA